MRHGMFRRTALAIGAGALLGLGVAPAVPAVADNTAAPADDPFYLPPSPLPAGTPGDIVRSRPAKFAVNAAVTSTQVLYQTQNATGNTVAVSGTVLVPTKAWAGTGPRPLVSYAVGTRGIGDSCAPSKTLAQGVDYEQFHINDLLNKGWAVAVTDMEGLGTPGVHPYIVGQSAGRAVLDMARAAQRLPGTGLNASTPVGVVGYSQGGSSAGWAAELAPTYAPDLNLKGVSAGGIPADPLAMRTFLEGGPFTGLMLMAALGFDSAYPDLKLDSYLNETGKRIKERYQSVCLVSFDLGPVLFDTAFRRINDFTTRSPLDDPAWQAKFNLNKLGSTRPAVPVFQSHARFDEVVGFDQGNTLRNDWCKAGTNLTWKTYIVAEHLIGFLRNWPDATAFLNDRFQNKPVTGNC
ncbi:lipase family protein [Thermomonospora umbrina]|uniref:Secretory lipase n=1 Tax=Thermomonospora umbrina TaxID=111806 RepID=A0A3D9SK49_9ACTN|nr:lipase family protein [Thermomonospora umbrina]REE96296.1 secretory lipase [Thermomonospora umbrina]